METQEFVRKTFKVNAVEVTLSNYEQVAEWCHGTIVMETTKMMGTEAKLPVIVIKGQGDNRGKDFKATLGCFVVELKGSFRVYKQAQFWASFENLKKDGISVSDELLEKTKEYMETVQAVAYSSDDGAPETPVYSAS